VIVRWVARSCAGPATFRTEVCVRAKPRAGSHTGARRLRRLGRHFQTARAVCAITLLVFEHPRARARSPVRALSLVVVPSGRRWGTRRPSMHDRISLCKCSHWRMHETIRPWDDPAPGSPEMSAHAPASPAGMPGGCSSQSGEPGRGAAAPGTVAGECSLRAVALAGLRVRLAGDGDWGPGLVRRRQSRASGFRDQDV
jgi:hypothetical protein